MVQIGVLLTILGFIQLITGVNSTKFTIRNQCTYTVWPGLLSNAGTPQLSTTGFALQPGESKTINLPAGWSGRLWGRTSCARNPTTGLFTCLTGDCGSTTVECSGAGAIPPATLAEFTLNGANGLDFFDVSLVDGYNLPMVVSPQGGGGGRGNCATTGCAADLNSGCPGELKVSSNSGESVACKSACEAFNQPQYCCSGAYATPDTCKPTSYSKFFKSACPRAYSYAYDDGTSTFTCANADYDITFCPSPSSTSLKASGATFPVATNVSKIPGSVAVVASESSASSCTISEPIPIAFVIVAAVWQLVKLLR